MSTSETHFAGALGRPLRSEVTRGAALSAADRAAYVDRYDGEIRFMDFHLGRLLAALERLRRYDDALIIVVGDHGELFGEHPLMEHGHALYEELIHVPLIIHFPGGRDGGQLRNDTHNTTRLSGPRAVPGPTRPGGSSSGLATLLPLQRREPSARVEKDGGTAGSPGLHRFR